MPTTCCMACLSMLVLRLYTAGTLSGATATCGSPPPPPREPPANKWITNVTWKIFGYCGMLRKKGMLFQVAACNLGQQVSAHLKAECLQCAVTTTSNVKECLAAGKFIEAWHHLKGWYCLAEDQAPKSSPETLAKQIDERIQLYTAVSPLRVGNVYYVDSSVWRTQNSELRWWWDNCGTVM